MLILKSISQEPKNYLVSHELSRFDLFVNITRNDKALIIHYFNLDLINKFDSVFVISKSQFNEWMARK